MNILNFNDDDINVQKCTQNWEIVKENVEPLKNGRNLNMFISLIEPSNFTERESIRKAMEEKIILNSNDDSLQDWFNFILWIEQNYPDGGRDSKVEDVLKDCIRRFVDDQKYHQDERFFEIFFKYIKLVSEPLEMFITLANKKMFTQLAKFYINWSWYLEILGNFKKANEILNNGIKENAQPIQDLDYAQKQLQMRIARKVASGDFLNSEFAEEKSRQALHGLKGKTVKKTGNIVTLVPNERVENSFKVPQQDLSKSSKDKIKNNQTPSIFVDENDTSSLLLSSKNGTSISSTLVQMDKGQENELKPGKWSENRIKQKSFSIAPVQPSSVSSFPIYEDISDYETAPIGKSFIKTVALKTRKRGLESPVIAKFEILKSNQKFYFDEKMLYIGGTEYSFEEIRGKKWLIAKQKEEERKKNEDVRKEVEQIQREREEEKKQNEKLREEVENLKKQMEIILNKSEPFRNSSSTSNKDFKDVSVLVTSFNLEPQKFEKEMKNVSVLVNNIESEVKDFKVNLHQIESNYEEKKDLDTKNSSPKQQIALEVKKNERSSVQKSFQEKQVQVDRQTKEVIENKLVEKSEEEKLREKSQAKMNENSEEKKNLNKNNSLSDYNEAESLVRGLWNGSLGESSRYDIGDISDIKSVKDIKKSFSIYQDKTCDNIVEEMNKIETNLKIEQVLGSKVTIEKENDSVSDLLKHISLEKINEEIKNEKKNDIQNVDKIEILKEFQENELKKIKNVKIDSLIMMDSEADKKEEKTIYTSAFPSLTKLSTIIENSREYKSASNIFQSEKKSNLISNSAELLIPTPALTVSNQVQENIDTNALTSLPTSSSKRESMIDLIDLSYNPKVMRGSMNFRFSEAFSMILPNSEQDCLPKCSSTPTNKKTGDEYKLVLMSQDNETQKQTTYNQEATGRLSPIVENSREYKSSSSSSGAHTINSTVSANSRRQRTYTPTSDIIDPFDFDLREELLSALSEPLEKRKGFYSINSTVPKIKAGSTYIQIGSYNYFVESLVAEGGYAKVYLAQIKDETLENESDKFASEIYQNYFTLKVCKPANKWEFYICNELHRRLNKKKSLPDIEVSILSADRAALFTNGSIIVDDYCPNGTLLDAVNACKLENRLMPKLTAAYFTLELIMIVDQIHKCDIIHADIKADNVLCIDFPNSINISSICSQKATDCLKIIDFGRSIDMSLFSPDTTFNRIIETKGHQCCEMLDGKPWTYQVDWFGVMDCVHLILFNDFIKVQRDSYLRWRPKEKFRRYHESFYESIFDHFLNLPNCSKVDISPFVQEIKQYLLQNKSALLKEALELSNIIEKHLPMLKK